MLAAKAERFNTDHARYSMLEFKVLEDFTESSKHLKLLRASTSMQYELYRIALPFHEKLKELGYKPDESRAMLKKAFGHKPNTSFGQQPKLLVFGGD